MSETKFKFHPVGQGCFYTGEFTLKKSNNQNPTYFHFVYDCGSNSNSKYIKNEINKFTKTIKSGKLDLLIISHFDSDHANHIDYLLNKINCEKVIIPYVSTIERLFLYFKSESRDNEYLNFLRDPIQFLLDKGVEQIIVITNEGSMIDLNDNIDFDDFNTNDDFQPIFNGIFHISENRSIIISKMTSIIDQILLDKVLVLKQNSLLYICKIWEFKFYCREITQKKLNNFQSSISDLIGIPYDDIKNDNLVALFKKAKNSEIKKTYKKLYNNINSTSLNVYHSPINKFQENINTCYIYNNIGCFPKRYFLMKKKNGTLLTGDIDLLKKHNYDKFEKYFYVELDSVSFLQVPHHGSKNNWHFGKTAKIRNSIFYL